MRFLRTNTAVIVTVGPFYDKGDGVTIETTLTITNERITLTADTDAGSAPTNILDNITGATSGTANDLNYITGNDAGLMQLELAAADVNRVGRMFLSITDAANHVPVFHEFMVLPAKVYDSLFLGTDNLEIDTIQWLGTAAAAPTTAGVPEVDVTHWIGTAAATPTVAGVPEVDLTHVAGVTTSVSTIASSIATLLAAIGTLTDAAVDGDPTTTDTLMQYVKQLVNTLVGSAGIPTFPAAAVAGNAVSLAEVIRSIDTRLPAALVSARIDASVGAMAAGTVTAAAIATDAIDDDAIATGAIASTAFAAGAINAAAIAGDAITDAKVAADVTIASVTGAVGSVTGAVGSVAAGGITAASIATGAVDADALATDAVTEIAAGITIPSAATIADAVWDEAVSGHVAAGTFGQGNQAVFKGAVAAGASGTVTLGTASVGTALSAVDDYYNGMIVMIVAGLGEGQFRAIVDYVGATKVATIDGDWITAPDSTSKAIIVGV